MKNIIKKESLRTAICLMLVLVMAVTILPENVQAVTVKSGFTMDLVDLKRSGDIKCFGKVGKGGAKFLNTVVEAPEGATVYIEEDFHICSGKYVYQVYYEGTWNRACNVYKKKQKKRDKGKKDCFGRRCHGSPSLLLYLCKAESNRQELHRIRSGWSRDTGNQREL